MDSERFVFLIPHKHSGVYSIKFMTWTYLVIINCLMVTQLSIPTHAQLQRHRLKFI